MPCLFRPGREACRSLGPEKAGASVIRHMSTLGTKMTAKHRAIQNSGSALLGNKSHLHFCSIEKRNSTGSSDRSKKLQLWQISFYPGSAWNQIVWELKAYLTYTRNSRTSHLGSTQNGHWKGKQFDAPIGAADTNPQGDRAHCRHSRRGHDWDKKAQADYLFRIPLTIS